MNQREPDPRSRLSAKKLALLESRLRGELPEAARQHAITPRPELDRIPLSFAQQRLWFLDQLMPGSPFYNIYNVVRVTYPVNPVVLERSIQEIVRRHEVFRTVFSVEEGEPVQIIKSTMNVPLEMVDLRGLAPDEREAHAQQRATAEVHRPFDLAEGPLLRTILLQISDSDSLILISMHHIVTDAWSMGIFFRELNTLYEAFVFGRPSPLPDPPLQYADFAVWQRGVIQGELKERELDYWRQQLDGAPALQMPSDRPHGSVQSFRGAYISLTFPETLNDALKDLSRREGVTLFMTLLAAFKTLIHRYTGQNDIIVGSPIAGRTRTELEQIIGFFVNTLVMRTRLSDEFSFRELLHVVQKVALEAYAHQDLPFEMLVEELQPERDPSRNPLFQVMFQVITMASNDGAPAAPDLPLEIKVDTAKFDLTLTLTDTGSLLTGSLEYNTDLFDEETAARLIRCYQTLLEGIAADPDMRLGDLPLLSAEEQKQLVVDNNATTSEFPGETPVHRLFEAQAATTPDAPAVTMEGRTVSYRELNEQANQLAHYLRRKGVTPQQAIGIGLERSIEMIVATLAVLKAGAVYLPLDPTHPKQRLATMLTDARAPLLLTNRSFRDRVPDALEQIIELDADQQYIAQENTSNLDGYSGGGQVAYIMYTSGSTGTPKGIMIPHKGIARLVLNTNYITIRPGDRMTHASNCSFDAATFEIWGALLNGAHLIIVPKDVTLSYEEYANFIQKQHIDVLFLTTALFNQLAQHAPWTFHTVRDLFFGGEAADARWVREVLQHGAPNRLLHVYGPTESTTYAMWQLVRDVPQGASTIPIGRAVGNTQIYLLDQRLHPVPIGVPGELYIGGEGLAHGYLNQPAMTAENFIPNPFASSGARLYKTGDLAQFLADGAIEFLGRADQQIKLRGFRIELGEIQISLEAFPGVRAAAVIMRKDRPGDPRLVAYLVPEPGADVPIDTLRTFLRDQLPEYMIPAAFVLLDALPLNPNGKIDRNALPAPADGFSDEPSDFVAPQTRYEKILASIWQDVLNREHVSVNDNFFDLGGHSLLLARVHNRLREMVKPTVPMIDLFQYPTIASLARHVESLQVTSEPAALADQDERQEQVRERVARQKEALQKRSESARKRRSRP